jgi:hypothetical protein
MKLYHGSPIHNLSEFQIDKPRYTPVEGAGVYLTLNYKIARGYAGSEGCVYVCELKSEAIFDATDGNEFRLLFSHISKAIGFELSEIQFFKETIQGLVSGQYQVSNDDGSGLFWQVKNLLLNEEKFTLLSDSDEKLELINSIIDDYLSQHPVLKYNDKGLGLVFVCRDPNLLKIVHSIDIGSDEDLDLL